MKFLKPISSILLLIVVGYFSYPLFFAKKDKAEPLRPIPAAIERPIQAPTAVDGLIYDSGTEGNLASVMMTDAKPESDEQGRPWTPITTARLITPRTLEDTSLYIVLKPVAEPDSLLGLFGAGERNYDNFIMVNQESGGSLRFRSETASGGQQGFQVPAEKAPAPGTPCLIEFHPRKDSQTEIFINGTSVGTLNAKIAINVFGGGYAGSHFRGDLGQIAAYQNLTGTQEKSISRALLNCWGLPGGDKSAFNPEYKLQPALANAQSPTANSSTLQLELIEPTETAEVSIGAGRLLPPHIDHLPKGASILAGQQWHITVNEPGISAALSFPQSETFSPKYIGSNGFYALFVRAGKGDAWRELTTTSATKDGQINFPPAALKTGEYTLGVIQGTPYRMSNASLNLASAGSSQNGDTVTVKPGIHITLKAKDTASGQTVTVREEAPNSLWYQGETNDLKLPFFALRNREIKLVAEFSEAPGVLPETARLTLQLDKDASVLYPGLVATVIRRDGEEIVFPSDFSSDAKWPGQFEENLAHPYPAFRTGESLHTPPFDDVTKPWFKLPNFFQTVLPSLNITPVAEEIPAKHAIHAYPLGDVSKDFRVYLSIDGELLLDTAGNYEFQMECNLPGKFSVNGQTSKDFSPIKVSIAVPSSVPFNLTAANTTEAPQLTSSLLWKRPGETEFSPVPNGILNHRVDLERETALTAASEKFAYRSTRLNNSKNDDKAADLLAKLKLDDPASLADSIKDSASFEATVVPLRDAYLGGAKLSGNPQTAQTIFALVHSRSQFIREHPDQLVAKSFAAQTDGSLMRIYESLLPVFGICDSSPSLQLKALNARAELAQYAVATCLSRSFFSEKNNGTNDGYGDENNLLVNFWRAARCIDSPFAWDAAACLQDSHFRYTAGRGEGVTSDGSYLFHNANGRHIHMNGYGANWFARVADPRRTHTPWGYTAEQYRRLSEYVLGYEWFIYQGTQAFVTNGRHNDHKGSSTMLRDFAARILKNPAETMRAQDRTDLEMLQQRITDNPLNSITGNRFFYRALFAVHRRPDFYIDVKMNSPLVGGPETFAGYYPWNISFGDGVTTLMRSGEEYGDIHRNSPNGAYSTIRGASDGIPQTEDVSLWRYRQLPGTTQLDDEMFQPDRYRGGGGEYAGGISDGDLGHCAFQFVNRRTGSEVCKFYGFTDDGMVVLNSGITTTRVKGVPADVTMRTTLNQSDWKGDIKVIGENGKRIDFLHSSDGGKFEFPLNQRYWVEHNGIGYLILSTGAEGGAGKPGVLELEIGERNALTPVPGWTMPEAAKNAILEKGWNKSRNAKVFQLSIKHGQQVKDASCAYFVCMRAAMADPQAWLKSPPVEILANQPAVQAIRDVRDGNTQAFFREAGELKDAAGQLLFKAPTPASVMWRPATSSLTVQDPIAACTTDVSKMLDTIDVTLGTGLKGMDRQKEISTPLAGTNDPDDRYRGKPSTVHVQ